MDKTL